MRMHVGEYAADPDRIAIWGDSSGGHTALMAGITAGAYPDNGTFGDVSGRVSCIVDWYGPTDIGSMNHFPSIMDHIEPASPEGRLIGFKNVADNPEAAAKASPINYIHPETDIPPILIMHGNRDELVCFRQSVELYRRLKDCGKDVRMVVLDGAYHGVGGFRCDAALDMVEKYLREKL